MRKTLLALGLTLAALCTAPLAMAQTTVVDTPTYAPNEKIVKIITMPATDYTNATTSPTDITGLTVTVPATTGDFSKQTFEVCYSAAASKATSTTGSISVLFSGTADATFTRAVTFGAANNSLSGCFYKARATASAVIIKLQGVSGDTAAFTVSEAQLRVGVIRVN